MAEAEKRWFEVTASVDLALQVFARDKNEAERLFWLRDEDIDAILMHPANLLVTSVEECEPPL